ncbi:MAG TPA: osmotically inducible protein OsmC [Actinobacteria bacterium]|nr:osmotically inducible protein OsmC [Actinomycetota bacterium]
MGEEMSEIKSREFLYKNHIKWESEKKGALSSKDKQSFQVATPPEFRGHPGIWNPEELFIAAVNSCVMTTFLSFAEKQSLDFSSYESEVEGVLKFSENKLMFTDVIVKPLIIVADKSEIGKAKDIIGMVEKHCLISNSIKSRVEIIPEVEVMAK